MDGFKNKFNESGRPFDIRERAFQFSVRIVKLCYFLERERLASKRLLDQLLDAGTSVGANLEEAQAGQSGRDFIHKNAISLKEARETRYWLRLLLATSDFSDPVSNRIQDLMGEANELALIIGKIIVNAKKKSETDRR